jgi:filamentous hemagglutinin family protein
MPMPRHTFLRTGLLSPALSFAIALPALAQITPDATLGDESSTLTPDAELQGEIVDLIEGGAIRGSNLFHSFQEFNVNEGQQVYFANPDGIASILSRITGGDPSNIFGTLGVDGAADLFLINPNGIVFGENAALDIEGSFYASTAEAIPLGDGIYSATEPEQSSLLTINPSALFSSYLTDASGDIENRGQLAAYENLTLAANNLDLQGQVAAGGELTLLGIDTVQIRDTAEVPFIGFAGGDLLVQGNQQVDIVALSHPDSGLYSYGAMVLRSANPVGGDAHYWSGGNFRVETVDGEVGALFSPVDPIIRAFGDVEIEGYLGSSLHILAGGSVTIGTAIINAPDAGELGIDFLQETITLSDGTFVEIDGGVQPTLDVRAGVASEALGASPFDLLTGFSNNTLDTLQGNALPTSESLSADITVANIVIRSPNGLVILTNQYQPKLEFPNGDISIDGTGAFEDGIDVRVFDGRGGDVFLDSRGSILSSGNILTSSNTGSSGNVKLLSQGETVFSGSSVFTRLFGVGEAGSIDINANSFTLENGGQLSANTLGQGSSGDIRILADDFILIEGEAVTGSSSGIFTAVEENAVGEGGNIEIQADSLILRNGGAISSSSVGEGSAGNITIDTEDSILVEGEGSIFSSSIVSLVGENTEGEGGDITITADSLAIKNGGQLSANTRGQGTAGDIQITADDFVLIEGEASDGTSSGIFAAVEENAVGNGASIWIQANSLALRNAGTISSSSVGNGSAGVIFIDAQDSVLVEGIGSVFVSAIVSQIGENAIGEGGDIFIETNSLILQNGGQLIAINAGQGSAGDIIATVNSLQALDKAIIGASTQGTGDAGSVVINARDRVTFDDGLAIAQVGVDAIGAGGNVIVTANILEVINGGQLVANTEGIGDAGNVIITARDRVLFDGVAQFSSAALSRVNRGAVGTGGNVEIITNTLEVLNGAQLGATTQGDGNAGSVIINAREQVLLQGSNVAELSDGTTDQLNSSISTFSEDIATGGGDDILITTPLLVVKDEAFIEAGTLNTQPGGDVVLTLGRLDVLNGGQVSTRSEGSGPAGTIRVDATEGIQVSGSALNVPSQATQMSSTIESQDVLSSLSVRSSADGPAGNIVIGAAGTTPEIVLDDGGQIIAESATVDGGNITLNLTDLLLLRNGSLISASAGTEQAGGNGGNIIITVPFIVAIPTENSDIAADAFEGIGGNVTINASGVFGIEPRPNRTPLSDITASSELGVSGLVNLNVLDTGFIENNLSSFEDTIIDTSTLTAGSCIARTADDQGSFVVTGRDGIPPRPGDMGIAAYPTGTVQTIESGGASLPQMHPTGTLQEPDGVYQLPDGRLVLSRECD